MHKLIKMRTTKYILVISTLILSCIIISCDTDPYIKPGNYYYYYGNLDKINGMPIQWSEDVSNEVKDAVLEIVANMLSVRGGDFEMGANDPTYVEEMPAHTVTLSSYYISATTVTQKQWTAIMGNENPLWSESYGKGDDYPANFVSYEQAKQFIAVLNNYSGLKFRMPTEAEWEYAACGGNEHQGYIYSGSNNANEVAWHRGNADGKMHPVATLSPNKFGFGWHDKGLYDMSGNVWEWCSDWYGSYSASSATNPTGPATGKKRVVRGGSFTYDAEYARCKARNYLSPNNQSLAIGLRLAMDAN